MRTFVFSLFAIIFSLGIFQNVEAVGSSIVVFDFGGVLTEKPDRESVLQFLQDTFLFTKEEEQEAHRARKQAMKAGISDEEFWLSYALEKGIELPLDWPKNFKGVLKKAIGINAAMYELIDHLKQREIPVALLSNIELRLANLIREFGFYDPFDPCLLSCELQIEKPDPRIYEYLIDLLGLPPEQIIFIDDKLENVEAARHFRIDGIHFQSLEQLKIDLQERGML